LNYKLSVKILSGTNATRADKSRSYRAFAFGHAASHCHGKSVCKRVGSDVRKARRIYAGWYKVDDTTRDGHHLRRKCVRLFTRSVKRANRSRIRARCARYLCLYVSATHDSQYFQFTQQKIGM